MKKNNPLARSYTMCQPNLMSQSISFNQPNTIIQSNIINPSNSTIQSNTINEPESESAPVPIASSSTTAKPLPNSQNNTLFQPYTNNQVFSKPQLQPQPQPYPNNQIYQNNQTIQSFDLNSKIKQLEQENLRLNNLLQERDNTITNLNQTISSLNNQITSLNNSKLNVVDNSKILELMEQLNIKIDEISKSQINQNDQLQANTEFDLKDGEKLLPIIFISDDKKIMYSIICKNTDSFCKIEEMLYKKYPEYGKTENSFLCNDVKINRFNTIEENKLDYSSIVTLQQNKENIDINKIDD